MHPGLRAFLAFLAGYILGSIVNMGIVVINLLVFPIEGVSITDMSSFAAHADELQLQHFIMVWLAHALGTLVAAYVAVRIATKYHLVLALIIGALFLVGGIMNAQQIPAPTAFVVVDLALAYIPMALLGHQLGRRKA